MFIRLSSLLIFLCFNFSTVAFAQVAKTEDGDVHPDVALEANITLISDYRFRGISQTSGNPSIQGGFDISTTENWYAGVWAANISGDGTIEIDTYAGIIFERGNVAWDFAFTHYYYPSDGGAKDWDYSEVSGSVSVKDLSLSLVYSNDYYAGTGGYLYPNVEYSFALGEEVNLAIHLGYNKFLRDNPGFFDNDTNSYFDWSIGVSTEAINNVIWSIALVGTDLNTAACFGDRDLCQTKLIAGISKSF